jgi:hypothetical protein
MAMFYGLSLLKSLKYKKPSSLVIHIFKKYISALFGIFHWDKNP